MGSVSDWLSSLSFSCLGARAMLEIFCSCSAICIRTCTCTCMHRARQTGLPQREHIKYNPNHFAHKNRPWPLRQQILKILSRSLALSRSFNPHLIAMCFFDGLSVMSSKRVGMWVAMARSKPSDLGNSP